MDSGPAFKSSKFVDAAQGIRLLRGDNIAPAKLRWSGAKGWPEADITGYEHLLVESDDLILGMDRPVIAAGLKLARVSSADLPALLVQRVARIRPKSVETAYLYHWLSAPGFARHLQQGATGTQLPHVTLKSIRDYPVPRFSAAEERRIVEFLDHHLSRLDATEACIRAARLRLDAMERAQLARTHRLLTDAPSRRIDDLAYTALGKMLDRKRQTGTPTPYLRNINVRWGAFDLDDIQFTQLEPSEIERFDVRRGDVFVCEGGEPGRCAVWSDDAPGLAYQKALHRLRVRDTDEVSPDFLALMLTASIRLGHEDHRFTGTTIKHLPQQQLRQIRISVPDIQDQYRVLAESQQVRTAIARLSEAIDAISGRSAALRRQLLADAFAGLAPTDSPDSGFADAVTSAAA